jgi:hypothetical protein
MHIADHPRSELGADQAAVARLRAGHSALDAELSRRGHTLSDADLRTLHDQIESAAGAAGKDASGEQFTIPSKGGRPIKAWQETLLDDVRRALQRHGLPEYVSHDGEPDSLCGAAFRIAARMAGSPILGDLRYLDKKARKLEHPTEQHLNLF